MSNQAIGALFLLGGALLMILDELVKEHVRKLRIENDAKEHELKQRKVDF